jgi:hypothetical protein
MERRRPGDYRLSLVLIAAEWFATYDASVAHPACTGRSVGRLAQQAGAPVPTIQRIFAHFPLDQTLHYVGVGQEEMTEGFAVFDRHLSAALKT